MDRSSRGAPRRGGLARIASGGFLLALLASCSLTRTSVDSCKVNADCRAGFGIGSTCQADGFCAKAPVNPRCSRTFPEDLLTRPESYPNPIVLGSLVVIGLDSQQARENATRLAATGIIPSSRGQKRSGRRVFCRRQARRNLAPAAART